MKIGDITNYLESIAPLSCQEEYDNSGLIIGDKNDSVNRVLITLDCTEDVIEEAISKDCNLIISHHPIVFYGLKKFNGSNYVERTVIKAIKNNIAIYSIHTNLDNVIDGVNSMIAKRIGLNDYKILSPKKGTLKYLVVYCPINDSDNLRRSLFNSGAGLIGNYDLCSFTSIGEGTFRANKGAEPALGKIGEQHMEEESRIEVVFSKDRELEVLQAMKDNHPYEEIAYQIYTINNEDKMIGSGIVGRFEKPINVKDFLQGLKTKMQTDNIRHTKLIKDKIVNIAICGGSGSFLLERAKDLEVDLFISSDFKYHQYFDADDKIIIADIGHYESEQFTKELIYDLLTKKFTRFAILLSEINTNPIKNL